MAKTNSLNPTAANVLSSLQIAGGALKGGTPSAGHVPVLDSRGLLDVSTLPLDEISAQVSIPHLAATAYVDPESGKDIADSDGSIARPFKTLHYAASVLDEDSRPIFTNFILSPGSYGTENVTFSQYASFIRIIGTGTVMFDTLQVGGYQSGATVMLFNISVTSTLLMSKSVNSNLVLLGYGKYGLVKGTVSNTLDPISSDRYLKSVLIGPCVEVTSYDENVETTGFIATTGTVGNVSVVVGKSVTDALNRLQGKKIIVPVFSKFEPDSGSSDPSDEEGISFTVEEVATSGSSSDSYDVYDIRRIGETLVSAVNATFFKTGDDIRVRDILARNIKVERVETESVETDSINFGETGINLKIDDGGFLVVEEE